jgi:light-harvesting complex II chlorophyll a/b binding protein 7
MPALTHRRPAPAASPRRHGLALHPTRGAPPANHRRWSGTAPLRARGAPPAALAESAALLAGAAVPFVAIQALADSDAGQRLKADLAARRPGLAAAAAAAEKERLAARARSPFYGERRPTFLGPLPIPGSLAAPHLTGDVAGDYGWDPLKLAAASTAPPAVDAPRLARYVELELLHARWAMLGALGALVPEAITLSGAASFGEDRWFLVGRAKLAGEDLNYFGVPGLRIAGGQGVAAIAAAQALLMSGPEAARAAGPGGLEPVGIFLPGDQNYPGGALFDPLGLAADPDAAVRLRVAEIKHGRLAMVAFVGYAAAAATGRSDGPLRDLVAAVRGGG